MKNGFLDGVNVICQIDYISFWFVALIICILFGVFCICMSIKCDNKEDIGLCIKFTIVSSVIVPILVFFIENSIDIDLYKVTIDESVSYVEFEETYNVINEHNGIYTIELKGDLFD